MKPLLLQSPSGPRPSHAQVKRWTRELLRLDEEVTLTIHLLRCAEPGCPDLETVIGISPAPGQWRRLRIPRALADLTRDDLDAAARHLLSDVSLTGNPQ